MEDTIPTDLKILTTKSRMKVLSALHGNSSKSTDVVSSEERRERLLAKAIDELISTERSYLHHLNIVVEFFILPLRENNLISSKEFNIIFGQIDGIIKVNQELLHQLATKSNTIGEAFLELAPFLKIYSSYVQNFDGALALIETLEKGNKEFAAFKSNQESRPEVTLKLSALLITPVQRIPRFKLLLEEIIQYTPPNAYDYRLLQDALHEVTAVANLINNFLHEQDNMQRILQIQQSLTNNQPKILVPGRRFIKEGPLMKSARNGRGSHRRIFFLFSDILMYCKALADDYTAPNTLMCCCIMPIRHCTVEPLFNYGLQSGTLMTLKCKDEEVILFTNDAEYGQTWVDALKSTVRQCSEFRQTLKKESTAKRPLRRAAILKQQEESLSQLSKKRKIEALEQDDDECKQVFKDALLPLRQLHNVRECLTPQKKRKLQLAPDEMLPVITEQHEVNEVITETEASRSESSNKASMSQCNKDFDVDEIIALRTMSKSKSANESMTTLDESYDSSDKADARKWCVIL